MIVIQNETALLGPAALAGPQVQGAETAPQAQPYFLIYHIYHFLLVCVTENYVTLYYMVYMIEKMYTSY